MPIFKRVGLVFLLVCQISFTHQQRQLSVLEFRYLCLLLQMSRWKQLPWQHFKPLYLSNGFDSTITFLCSITQTSHPTLIFASHTSWCVDVCWNILHCGFSDGRGYLLTGWNRKKLKETNFVLRMITEMHQTKIICEYFSCVGSLFSFVSARHFLFFLLCLKHSWKILPGCNENGPCRGMTCKGSVYFTFSFFMSDITIGIFARTNTNSRLQQNFIAQN